MPYRNGTAPLPLIPMDEFKTVQDNDLVESYEQIGNHLAYGLIYWRLAETQEERDKWAAYIGKAAAVAKWFPWSENAKASAKAKLKK
jgi:hypothetical protein